MAGLWPFHAPGNHVTSLPNRNGLAVGKYGTVLSAGDINLGHAPDDQRFSFEIWIKSAVSEGSGTLLTFYNPQEPYQLSLRQSLSNLVIQTGTAAGRRARRVYLDNFFQQARAVFLTITADAHGINVYQNGSHAQAFSGFYAARKLRSFRIVIGTAPHDEDTWAGQIFGLAVYKSELSPERVRDHFRSWTQDARPAITPGDKAAAIYLFTAHSGRTVRNDIPSGVNLFIPDRFVTLDQSFLKAPWVEYHPEISYWEDLLINIAGFIPLGFCFCAYWAQRFSIRRAAWLAILLGIAVTFTIEILQAYLPTRQSGVTDLFTNTFGTCIGAVLYGWSPIREVFERTLERLLSRWIS